MNSAPSTMTVTASDRLGTTLFIAAAAHLMLILGISFTAKLSQQSNKQKPLDIVIANTQSVEEPEDAKNIAQFNQQASGSVDETGRPSTPLASVRPTDQPGHSPVPIDTKLKEQAQQAEKKILVAKESAFETSSSENTEEENDQQAKQNDSSEQRKLEMAQLAAEMELADKRYAQRPRVHFVDALSAKSAVEAMYVGDWVRRVEGMGNLNYPESARTQKLSGRLTLSVRLNHNGDIVLIDVDHSSGSALLDNAAKKIVQLASPFMQFPAEMREKYDQLDITRTWVFHSGTNSVR